jgi:uncharacterized protein (TIGR03083 family)
MRISPRYDGPALIEIDGAPDDQMVPMTRQRRRFETMLRGLDDEAWRAPSRCDEWTVQDVASHLVGVNAFWQMSIAAGLSGAPTRVLTNFDPAATPELLIAPMRSLPPREVLDQLAASHDGLLDAIATLDADQWQMPAESPPGYVPIRLLAYHALWDCWIHERDVALPLGRTPPVEADEVSSSLRYAAALGPGFLLTAERDIAGAYGVHARDPDVQFWLEIDSSVHVHDGAPPTGAPCLRGDAVELTEALSIRGPLPDDTPDAWRALLGGLTTAFS